MKRLERGFTLIELLIVLLIITSIMGLLFPLGNHLTKKSLQLSVQADVVRYQNAFLDYFEAFDAYPEGFPEDAWFDLTQYFSSFVNFFTAKTENRSNFCRFTAQEIQEKQYPHPVKLHFFLCKEKDVSDALKGHPGKTIQGTQVLYVIEFE
ncbi:MAG: prepilin-type N-terminal cleavage/methylation domain-containing protein [Opitutales bacterium]